MVASAKPMHPDFARWYSAVSFGDDARRRQSRWDGLLKVVTNANREVVEALVRLAYGTRAVPERSILQGIRQDFKDTDETFEMVGNERELQVLAGACLAVLMEDSCEEEGSAAALAVTTAALGRARTLDLPMDLVDMAESAIVRRANENRERPSIGDLSSDPPKFDFEKSSAKVRETPNWDGVAEGFALAADAVRTAMRTLAARQTTALSAAEAFIRVQDEELQMLWWLMGGRCNDYDSTFDGIPVEVQSFVFGDDLADATTVLPGPSSIRAILSRAGLKERKKISVVAAVNAPKTVWLKSLMNGAEVSSVSTPLHFAIQRQLETGAGDAWVAGWAASTGIDATHSLPSLTLGELFYRERLLILFG